jgi:outer membrane cobalamin receptor
MKASRLPRVTLAVVCAVAANPAVSQTTDQPAAATLDPLVVTATRSAERVFDVPAAIDVVNAPQIQRRYFEPAATRNYIVGVSINVSL